MSFAAASRIPCPVNVDTVKPITARRHMIADIATQFSSMTLSNSVKRANSTYPVVTKHQPKSLPINVFTAKGVPAPNRIQERRRLIAAKLRLPATKRPKRTFPAIVPTPRKHGKIICRTLGRNFRQGDMHTFPGPIELFVDFSDRVRNTPSRIPSDFSGRRPFTKGGYNLPAIIKPVFLPLLPSSERGDLPYCKSRWYAPNPDRNPFGYGLAFDGAECPCHGPPLKYGYYIGPRQWSTTPAEAEVDPKRARKVRFAGTTSAITPTDDHGKYFRELWWTPEDHAANRFNSWKSIDPARIEEDNRALALLDSAPAPPPAKLSTVDLQAIFDECNFTDDED